MQLEASQAELAAAKEDVTKLTSATKKATSEAGKSQESQEKGSISSKQAEQLRSEVSSLKQELAAARKDLEKQADASEQAQVEAEKFRAARDALQVRLLQAEDFLPPVCSLKQIGQLVIDLLRSPAFLSSP